MPIIQHLIGVAQGKHPLSSKRSNAWPAARKSHLAQHPTCAVCGGKANLEVHHIKPFHLHPDLELDPSNFVTLCEAKKGGVNCHLFVGHLGNFRSFNVNVIADSAAWLAKLFNRPKSE
ncbi:MAG: HNH endonuclease [Burkholderiaceae bacterium]|nr:HNH endonuclease [Burkholderiaceae bacterium]